MDQDMSEALEQAKDIVSELEKATGQAQREMSRLILHFAKKGELGEVERMKQRISTHKQ